MMPLKRDLRAKSRTLIEESRACLDYMDVLLRDSVEIRDESNRLVGLSAAIIVRLGLPVATIAAPRS